MSRYKHGQVGETVSWVVATLIIVGILIVFIYISILMADLKKINLNDVHIDSEKEINFLSEKTAFAHTLSSNKNKEMIDNLLKEGNA